MNDTTKTQETIIKMIEDIKDPAIINFLFILIESAYCDWINEKSIIANARINGTAICSEV